MDMLYPDAKFYIYSCCEKETGFKDVVMQFFYDALKIHMNGTGDFCVGLRCPCNRIEVYHKGRRWPTHSTNVFMYHLFLKEKYFYHIFRDSKGAGTCSLHISLDFVFHHIYLNKKYNYVRVHIWIEKEIKFQEEYLSHLIS